MTLPDREPRPSSNLLGGFGPWTFRHRDCTSPSFNHCCQAGAVACPQPCPWHAQARRADRDWNALEVVLVMWLIELVCLYAFGIGQHWWGWWPW